MTGTINSKEGCFARLSRLFGGAEREQDAAHEDPARNVELPYHMRDHFLSPAEISLYHVLSLVVGTRAVVCPKVRLGDIFYIGRPHENWSYRQRIAQKHIDFLLCEPKTMRPVVGVELDDRSHTRSDRQARDKFVDRVFQAAGLPLIRIPAQTAYNTSELSGQLAPYLEEMAAAVEVSGSIVDDVPPSCPRCGVPMIVRTAKKGQHRGHQFYGCPNFPQCREMLPVDRTLANPEQKECIP